MIRSILLLSFGLLSGCAFGQNPPDTLSLWNYQFQSYAKPQKDKSIAQITFWRTRPIHDSIHFSLHQENWTPQISFSVYPLADSAFCRAQSQKFKMVSSCMGPDVGGDMHHVGNFILLNRDICLSCIAYVSKKDYCRPVVNQLLNAIDPRTVKKLADLEAQLHIKKGDPGALSR
jgi:hypothetical protein